MKQLKIKQFSQNVDIYNNNNYPVEEIKLRLKTLDNPFEWSKL